MNFAEWSNFLLILFNIARHPFDLTQKNAVILLKDLILSPEACYVVEFFLRDFVGLDIMRI